MIFRLVTPLNWTPTNGILDFKSAHPAFVISPFNSLVHCDHMSKQVFAIIVRLGYGNYQQILRNLSYLWAQSAIREDMCLKSISLYSTAEHVTIRIEQSMPERCEERCASCMLCVA